MDFCTLILAVCFGNNGEFYFDRTPYLQSMTSDSVTIVSQTVAMVRSDLKAYTSQGPVITLREDAPSHDHIFILQNLEGATQYFYEIVYPDARFGGSFKTLPKPGSGESIIIGVYGDSGYAGEGQDAVSTILSEMGSDLLLHVGDLAYPAGHPVFYQNNFFEDYAELISTTPIFPVPGNHDCMLDIGFFQEAFVLPDGPQNSLSYSFDAGEAHLVGLNTCLGLTPEIVRWLEDDLQSTRQIWKIVFMHHPAYSSGPHGAEPWIQTQLVPILERTKVSLVLSGHEHKYERFHPIFEGKTHKAYQSPNYADPRGIVYVITGGGGGNLYEEEQESEYGIYNPQLSAISKIEHHAISITVSSDELRVQAISPQGEIDAFRISRVDLNPLPVFLIGDSNGSGNVNISDAISILGYLFLGTREVCLVASDVNDDHDIGLADAIYLLQKLFLEDEGIKISQCLQVDSHFQTIGCRNECE